MSDELIDRLAAGLQPVRPTALRDRLLLAVLAGLALSGGLMWGWLGPRPDMAAATGTAIFWIKSGYTFVLGLIGVWAVERLGRPGGRGRAPLLAAAACFLLVALAAAADYAAMPAGMRGRMLMGASASACPYLILVLSMPLLVSVLGCMRLMAPTRPVLAGAAAGLATGALGAWVYSFHCDEPGLPFLASWYSLGIVIVTALGALLGKPLLRW